MNITDPRVSKLGELLIEYIHVFAPAHIVLTPMFYSKVLIKPVVCFPFLPHSLPSCLPTWSSFSIPYTTMDDEVLTDFIERTKVEPALANDLLEATGWDLEAALAAFEGLQDTRAVQPEEEDFVFDSSE